MIYTPRISNYKPFYIQIGSQDAIDLIGAPYYIIVKSPDYPPYKVKEPYKNDWLDEHGDEEYIASSGLYVEAFSLNLECAMFAIGDQGQTEEQLIANLNARLRAFRENLRAAGFFKIYDSFTGFGFKDVRLEEFPTPDAENYSVTSKFALTQSGGSLVKTRVGDQVRLIFTVTLKVNDPVTQMVYDAGSLDIVEA